MYPSTFPQVEEDWRLHVSEVMRVHSAEHAVHTFHLFTRLFQDTSAKLSALTTESCSLLKKPSYIQQLSGQICILSLTSVKKFYIGDILRSNLIYGLFVG